VRDTQCSACGKWLAILSDNLEALYCDDYCRRSVGLPGKGQKKRELRIGEIVQGWHLTSSGTQVGSRYYLVYPQLPAVT
jgi:hypothetical protein